MALASLAFALSPNLLAHGSLVTMEMPLLACSSAMLYGFWLPEVAAEPRLLLPRWAGWGCR